jgi:FkbM family methyltransferase
MTAFIRDVGLSVFRVLPVPVTRQLKKIGPLRSLYRSVFDKMVGDGEVVQIKGGPLKGLSLVTGYSITHAQINGTYELELAQCIDRILKPGMVCYDLGASTGYFSLQMAKRGRLVYSFEPTPHTAAWVKRNADANGFSHINVIPTVVSDRPKQVIFQMTGMGYGSQVIAANQTDDRYQRLELTATTLDTFVEDHEMPDLMKIDIEGEESNALSSATRILKEKRPIIACEIHDLDNAARVEKILVDANYKITALDGSPFEMPKSIYPGDFHILATPR